MDRSTPTTPIECCILDARGHSFHTSSYLTFCILAPKNMVKYHKAFLGKQAYCFTGVSGRFWVWESDSWRVWVNNVKGPCFEVLVGSTQSEAQRAWMNYVNDMSSKS
jgi:hypothetical protein